MASIVLSFVGQQDPFAKNDTEGSIVSLVRYLRSENYLIDRVVLLHTQRTQANAIDTQQWLLSDGLRELSADKIICSAVDEALSEDPIDSLLAIQVARSAVAKVQERRSGEDWLELNASSGTPAMKAAWSILQAAGSVPQSRVWQVRNPQEMQVGQERVFLANVNALRQEFDRQVAQRQVQDYNYSGARITLEAAGLLTPVLGALLNYGRCRLALDFDRAYSAIAPFSKIIDKRWVQEISGLRQRNSTALLKEAYFNAAIRHKNQEYSNFLVDLSRFQEGVLRYCVAETVGMFPTSFDETEQFWARVKQLEQGNLHRFLTTYSHKGRPLTLEKFPNRFAMMAIAAYYPEFADILPSVQALNHHCEQRNRFIHHFEGISQLEEADECLVNMRQILKKITTLLSTSPFDQLNQSIITLLKESLHR